MNFNTNDSVVEKALLQMKTIEEEWNEVEQVKKMGLHLKAFYCIFNKLS